MKFVDFKVEATTKTLAKEKMKANATWLNFSDKIWTLQLFDLTFYRSKIELKQPIKILLIPNTSKNVINEDTWSIDWKVVNDVYPMYNDTEDTATPTRCPFILCDNKEKEFEENILGLGIYTTQTTKRKRYKIEVEKMVLFFNEDRVYNIVNSLLEVDF
jgi:hypothetical protein